MSRTEAVALASPRNFLLLFLTGRVSFMTTANMKFHHQNWA